MKAELDYTEFQRGLSAMVQRAGIQFKRVIKKESGELLKTLVRLSYPENRTKTNKNIEQRVRSVFKKNESVPKSKHPNNGGIKWYAANSEHIYGIAPQKDLRGAGFDEVYATYKQIRGKPVGAGRESTMRRNTKQTAVVINRFIVKRGQIREVIRRVQSHVGRMKAGWLPAVRDGVVKISGEYSPPGFVVRHYSGARGKYQVDFSDESNLFGEFTNFAKGIGKHLRNNFINRALQIRGRAMAKNAELYFKGKKFIGEYR